MSAASAGQVQRAAISDKRRILCCVDRHQTQACAVLEEHGLRKPVGVAFHFPTKMNVPSVAIELAVASVSFRDPLELGRGCRCRGVGLEDEIFQASVVIPPSSSWLSAPPDAWRLRWPTWLLPKPSTATSAPVEIFVAKRSTLSAHNAWPLVISRNRVARASSLGAGQPTGSVLHHSKTARAFQMFCPPSGVGHGHDPQEIWTRAGQLPSVTSEPFKSV